VPYDHMAVDAKVNAAGALTTLALMSARSLNRLVFLVVRLRVFTKSS
jgi:hypothetical protein